MITFIHNLEHGPDFFPTFVPSYLSSCPDYLIEHIKRLKIYYSSYYLLSIAENGAAKKNGVQNYTCISMDDDFNLLPFTEATAPWTINHIFQFCSVLFRSKWIWRSRLPHATNAHHTSLCNIECFSNSHLTRELLSHEWIATGRSDCESLREEFDMNNEFMNMQEGCWKNRKKTLKWSYYIHVCWLHACFIAVISSYVWCVQSSEWME